MTFNFNAKYVLLTYAQCGDLDPWAIVNHLAELRAECIVGRETHADGGTHLHCFAHFERKFRSRRADVFDVLGCHPNVSPTYTTPQAGWDYACKDGDIVAGGLQDQMLAKSLEVETCGMISWLQKVETSFLDYSWNLLRSSYAAASPNLRSTLTGDTALSRSRTSTQQGLSWYRTCFLSLASGYRAYLQGIQEVSLARQRGDPPGTKSSGSHFVCSRGPPPPL